MHDNTIFLFTIYYTALNGKYAYYIYLTLSQGLKIQLKDNKYKEMRMYNFKRYTFFKITLSVGIKWLTIT